MTRVRPRQADGQSQPAHAIRVCGVEHVRVVKALRLDLVASEGDEEVGAAVWRCDGRVEAAGGGSVADGWDAHPAEGRGDGGGAAEGAGGRGDGGGGLGFEIEGLRQECKGRKVRKKERGDAAEGGK